MKFMKIIEGIEGDYIETKKTHLFFDVKGLLHPNERKISFLRFFPHPKGSRIKNNVSFKKIYKLSDRYTFLRENYPNYLFFSKEFDLEVQGVRNEDIKMIYSPRKFLKELIKKDQVTRSENLSRELCEFFISEGNLSENSLGITGSLMVGLNTDDSDIDLIIYGTENSIEFQKTLTTILKNSKMCRKYNMGEYKTHYKWRFGGSEIPFESFLKSEQRKLHQGKYKNVDFFIRYIKSPEDWGGNFYDYQYNNYGRIKLRAEIMDSKDSIFTPCSYKISPRKILENGIYPKNINIKNISEIASFRGRFCEQVKDGEMVLVEGKLEKVSFQNKQEYFRILLSDPLQDKLIII